MTAVPDSAATIGMAPNIAPNMAPAGAIYQYIMCIGTEAEVPGVGPGRHDRAVVASAALETVIWKGGPAAIFRKNFVLKQRARAILER